MFFSLKLLIALILIVIGAAAILVAYQKWKWAAKLVFGKERVKSAPKMVFIYLYVIGGFSILVALLLLF